MIVRVNVENIVNAFKLSSMQAVKIIVYRLKLCVDNFENKRIKQPQHFRKS